MISRHFWRPSRSSRFPLIGNFGAWPVRNPLISDATRHHTSQSSSAAAKKSQESPLKVTFITAEGEEITCPAKPGEHLLDIAHANQVDLEGACEASLACSTCHVIVEDPAVFDRLPEATDEENDMLDMAFGLTETSRLGCQIFMTESLNGLRVRIPSATRNMAVDGYKPKPH